MNKAKKGRRTKKGMTSPAKTPKGDAAGTDTASVAIHPRVETTRAVKTIHIRQ